MIVFIGRPQNVLRLAGDSFSFAFTSMIAVPIRGIAVTLVAVQNVTAEYKDLLSSIIMAPNY